MLSPDIKLTVGTTLLLGIYTELIGIMDNGRFSSGKFAVVAVFH
jgi:hypothetical protein